MARTSNINFNVPPFGPLFVINYPSPAPFIQHKVCNVYQQKVMIITETHGRFAHHFHNRHTDMSLFEVYDKGSSMS